MQFSDLLISPHERLLRDMDQEHGLGYVEAKNKLTGAVTGSAMDAARGTAIAAERAATGVVDKAKAWQMQRELRKAQEAAEVARKQQEIAQPQYAAPPKFAAFWKKDEDDEGLGLAGVVSSAGVLGGSAADAASDAVQREELESLRRRGNVSLAPLLTQRAWEKDGRGLEVVVDGVKNRNVAMTGDTPEVLRDFITSRGLHRSGLSPVAGTDSAALRGQEAFEQSRRMAILPAVGDSRVVSDTMADVSPAVIHARRHKRPGYSLISPALTGGLMAGAYLAPEDQHGLKATMYGGAAAASAAPAILDARAALEQWYASDQHRKWLNSVVNLDLPGGVRSQTVRRIADVGKVPLGLAAAALPAYMAYKEWQKRGSDEKFLLARGLRAMGAENIADSYKTFMKSKGRQLSESGLFDPVPNKGIWKVLPDKVRESNLLPKGDVMSAKLKGLAQEDPESAAMFAASSFLPGPQWPVYLGARRATNVVSDPVGDLDLSLAPGDVPGLGSKVGVVTQLDNPPFISTADAEQSAPAADLLKTEQGHKDPAMGNSLPGNGKLAIACAGVRGSLLKEARKWTPAQRRHYFKMLKAEGKYKSKAQYDEDKAKNYKVKEVQRPHTSEKKAEDEQESPIASRGKDLAKGTAAMYGSTRLVRPTYERVLGTKGLVHGTSMDNAQSILREGMRPGAGSGNVAGELAAGFEDGLDTDDISRHNFFGGQSEGGLSTAAGHGNASEAYSLRNKGVKYTPKRPKDVKKLESLTNSAQKFRESPLISPEVNRMLDKAIDSSGLQGEGVLLSTVRPWEEFSADFEVDPEMPSMLHDAHRTKRTIPAEDLKWGTPTLRHHLDATGGPDQWARYAKKYPGRLGAGLALGAMGAGGAAWGASKFRDAVRGRDN